MNDFPSSETRANPCSCLCLLWEIGRGDGGREGGREASDHRPRPPLPFFAPSSVLFCCGGRGGEGGAVGCGRLDGGVIDGLGGLVTAVVLVCRIGNVKIVA